MIELCEPPLDLGTACKLTACRYDRDGDVTQLAKQTQITLPKRLANAVNKRKVEYLSGRYCVAESLSQLTSDFSPYALANSIDNAEDRSPVWPVGYVGAITHSHSFAAAAVAQNKYTRSVGIDSEQLIKEKTAEAIHSQIITNDETYSPDISQGLSEREYLTVLFSAKESIYKCLHPLVKQFFGFDAASVTLVPCNATDQQHIFHFTLLKQLNDEFCLSYKGEGHWRFHAGFAHTAVVLSTDLS
ncbi:4'-phosphopantetheinyl transferase family protein [Aurantivibrio plasticivorans]